MYHRWGFVISSNYNFTHHHRWTLRHRFDGETCWPRPWVSSETFWKNHRNSLPLEKWRDSFSTFQLALITRTWRNLTWKDPWFTIYKIRTNRRGVLIRVKNSLRRVEATRTVGRCWSSGLGYEPRRTDSLESCGQRRVPV